jgi:hypothetical protein
VIRELATYIANETALELGVDLHVGYFPDDDEEEASSMIRQGGGDAHPRSASASREDVQVQVLTRAAVQSESREAARLIFDTLFPKANIDLPQVNSGPIYHVFNFSAGLPQPIGRDKLGRFEFSANYTVRLQEA